MAHFLSRTFHMLLFLLLNALPVSAFNLLIACPDSAYNITTAVLNQFGEDLEEPIYYRIITVTGSSMYEDISDYCSSERQRVSAILDLTENCQMSDWSSVSHVPYLPVASCPNGVESVTPDTSVYFRAILDIFSAQDVIVQQMTVFADASNSRTELLNVAEINDTVQIRALNILPDEEGARKDQLLWAVSSLQVGLVGYLNQIRQLMTEICKLKNRPKSTIWAFASVDENIAECFGCDFNNSLYLRAPDRDQGIIDKLSRLLPEHSHRNLGYKIYESIRILYNHWLERNSTGKTVGFDLCMATGNNSSMLHEDWVDEGDSSEQSHTFGTVTWDGETFQQDYQFNIARYSCNEQVPTTESIGRWRSDFVSWTVEDNLWQSDGSILRVTTVPEAPFVYKVVDENGTITYTGYSIDVLTEIVTRLKVNYTIQEAEDGQFGSVLPDGSWTGMIGEVHRKTADMAVGPISVTAEREQVVDFATPYYDFAGIQIMIKKTEVESSMFTFTTVFSIEVWLCWFSVLGATAILLHAFDRLSHCKCGKDAKIPQPHREGFDLKDSFWFVIASLTLSGPEKRPRSFSSRILVTGFWFFCSIMMATYTANLAALLTLSRLSAPVANMEDLLAQSQIRYSTMEGTSMQTYFKRMAEIETNFYEIWKEMSYGNDSNSAQRSRYAVWDYPLPDRYKVIWQQMEETGFVNSSESGIDKVLKGNYAYFSEAPIIKYKMSQHCEITAVGNQFSAKPYAFALQEKSALTSVVSGIILELQQERVLETLKQKWWPEVTSTCGSVEASEGVGILEMAGIFMLVAAGVVCGVLTLFIELICYKVIGTSKKRKKKQEASVSASSNNGGTENYRVALDMSEMTNPGGQT